MTIFIPAENTWHSKKHGQNPEDINFFFSLVTVSG
jgi:hypothetical protein